MRKIKQNLLLNAKNTIGWKTKRKIVVFAVDDYGNVRVDSKKARERMNKAGLKVHTCFDAYDSLETEEDLLMLYEALSSVKDKNGNHPVFTALSLPANIDFEKMQEEKNERYIYELLPVTFQKTNRLKAWSLWKEGMDKRLIFPQFHGREHLNLKTLNHNLKLKDHDTLISLQNRSYTSISSKPFINIKYTAAFHFDTIADRDQLNEIVEDGLNKFQEVFGFRSISFNPPGGREHVSLHKELYLNGVKYLETPLLKKEHQGNGKYSLSLNYTGKKNKYNQTLMVRNCVFEPSQSINFDWVGYTMKQIEVSFRWNKPAVISSHRVNYCGHIDSSYRKLGIERLTTLLKKIKEKWPNVEFLTNAELGNLISQSNNH